MKEAVLRDFFAGMASAEQLARDVRGAIKRVSAVESYQLIEDMDTQWTVTRPMLVALCDAILEHKLTPDSLHQIGFALIASDHFEWEDDLIASVVSDWSCPEINYALTSENVARFRKWLLEEEPYPPKPGIDEVNWDKQRTISRLEKRRKKPWLRNPFR